MSFVRPEVIAGLQRWRESLAGAAAVALGSTLWTGGTGAAKIIGGGLILGGVLLALAGLQRARFRRGGEGPGVVSVVEGRLSYFGPEEGGVVAMADLRQVDLFTGPEGSVWIIEALGAPAPIRVPVNAAGADVLFDVFAALDGIDTQAMLRAVESTSPGRVMIWAKAGQASHITAH